MDKYRITKIVAVYRKYFEDNKIGKSSWPPNKLWPTRAELKMYCHNDLSLIENLIEDGNIEEASDTLSRIQGCLLAEAVYTKEEIQDQNSL